jgi:hypothetical protein
MLVSGVNTMSAETIFEDQHAECHIFFNILLSRNLTYLLTYSMERSPSGEADQSLQLVKKLPAFLWNPKVFYRTPKCPPPVPILGQLHPVPTTPSNFLNIHLNIILPSTSGSPQWPLSLRFHHQYPVHPSLLPHTHHMPRTSHSSRFNHPHNIG